MAKNAFRSTVFQSRIKKIMQSDEDVGKVAAASTSLVAQALEEFLKILLDESITIANDRNARMLTSSHLKATVMSNPLLDFCKDATAHAPDLPPPGTTDQAQPKRARRTKAQLAADKDSNEPSTKRTKKKSGGDKKKVVKTTASPETDNGGEIYESEDEGDDAHDDADGGNAMLHSTVVDSAPGKEAEEEDYDEF